jgi:hypothetical protein
MEQVVLPGLEDMFPKATAGVIDALSRGDEVPAEQLFGEREASDGAQPSLDFDALPLDPND